MMATRVMVVALLSVASATHAYASSVQYMGYYGCEPSTQRNHTNLCITSSPYTLVQGAAAGMAGMAQVTWAFFKNARPPRAAGLQLRADYAAGWATARATCGPGPHGHKWSPPCSLDALRASGTTIGVFVGDELLLQGVTVAELTTAAAAVKAAWGAANRSVVYWNEAWDPVVNNASYAKKHPASALCTVPTEVDWVSLDYYRRDATAWTVPEAAYASALYPKMVRKEQRALLVPGAFGRKHDVCGAVGSHCGGNASLPICCAGQTNHSAEWWDNWSATVAEHYYDWAKRDARVIGINPWYYGPDEPVATCGGNNISVRQQPTARQKWADIGRAIMGEKQNELKTDDLDVAAAHGKRQSASVTLRSGVVNTVDAGFKSWTIDGSSDRGFYERDLKDPALRYLARASRPGYMRFGGTGNDDITYSMHADCSHVGCLNRSHFEDLMGFANASGAKLVFGLNIMKRDAATGTWDPTNARSLLTYAVGAGHAAAFFGFELGNEKSAVISAERAAADCRILAELLAELWPSEKPIARPVLIGPDPLHTPVIFRPILKSDPQPLLYARDFARNCSALGVKLFALTHHEYVGVGCDNGALDPVCNGTLPSGMRAPPSVAVLDRTKVIAAEAQRLLGGLGPAIWAGEIGPQGGGGPPKPTADGCDGENRWGNFGDSLWYLDAMGVKAATGYSVFARQDFVGIDYGLLGCAKAKDRRWPVRPDFYSGLIWSMTMGAEVLAVNYSSPTTRAYAHCETGGGGRVTLLLINLSRELADVSIELPSGAAADTVSEAGDGAGGKVAAAEYVLRGGDGGATNSTRVDLNGEPLLLRSNGSLPLELLRAQPSKLRRNKKGDVLGPYEMKGYSVSFLQLPGVGAALGCTGAA